jgi:tetratricopeptide (TPR) repeat protein
MRTLEALVLRCWLRPLTPRLIHHPDAPLAALAADAVSRLSPRYGGEAVLSAAMAAAVRRAAARSLPDLRLYTDPKDLLAATEALRDQEGPFLALMDAPPPLERALQMALDSVEVITGLGGPLVPHTLRWLPLESREVLPLIGPEGLEAVRELLEAWLPRLTPGAREAAERDLGSALSLLGRREDARARFEAVGDTARVLLEECDAALEAGQWPLASALATLCVRAAEETEQPVLAAAALRRQSSAAERQGDYPSASHHMRGSLSVARRSADHRAAAAALEELSRLAADQGHRDEAVSLLGEVWMLQRREDLAAGEERALRLAGRLLAESGEVGPGLVMLLAALDLAEARDPHTAHGIKQYIVGFQYTLTDAEFSKVEPFFSEEREPIIIAAFAAAAARARR